MCILLICQTCAYDYASYIVSTLNITQRKKTKTPSIGTLSLQASCDRKYVQVAASKFFSDQNKSDLSNCQNDNLLLAIVVKII